MKYRYRFKIFYANKHLQDISKMMSKLDLGFDGMAIEETITFSSEKDNEISKLKEVIKAAFESCGCIVMHLEGGKIE